MILIQTSQNAMVNDLVGAKAGTDWKENNLVFCTSLGYQDLH
jgi:hypothetical protein